MNRVVKLMRGLCVLLPLMLSGCGMSSYFSWIWPWGETEQQTEWNITDKGVGSLTLQTRFDQQTLTTQLGKDYRLRQGMGIREGKPSSFYEVVRTIDGQDQVLMVIYSDQQQAIEQIIVQDKFAHSGNVQVGTPFFDVYNQAFGPCHRAEGEYLGSLICWAPNSTHVSYIFSGQPDYSDTLLPADDVLMNWKVTKIIWHPKRTNGEN